MNPQVLSGPDLTEIDTWSSRLKAKMSLDAVATAALRYRERNSVFNWLRIPLSISVTC
jgi:hypothetical protein